MSYTWTLFTLGNGDIIFAVFNSLQALMKSILFTGLLNIVFLIGFVVLLFSSVAKGRLPITYTVRYLLFTAIFIRGLLSFGVNVGIVDCVNPANNKVITHVPFILAAPASLLSQLGKFLALEIDTFYGIGTQRPDKLGLVGGSYNIAGTLIKDSLSYRFNDPRLKKSVSYFFVDCVTPLISRGIVSAHDILTSRSIWDTVKPSNYYDALMTVYYSSTPKEGVDANGQVTTCRQAYHFIDNDLHAVTHTLLPGYSISTLQTVLNYTTSNVGQTQRAKQYLQQSALLHLLSHATLDLMAARTRSAVLMHYLNKRATLSPVESHWVKAAQLFQSVFGYLYSVLQVMVYAMLPLVVVFCVLPGLRGLLLKRYLQLLAWFPVTLVLMSIVNNVLLTWSVQLLGPIWHTYGGLTFNGQIMLSKAACKLIEVGQWLMTLVPLIAWSMVSGLNTMMNTLWQGAVVPAAGQPSLGNGLASEVNHEAVSHYTHDIAALPTHAHASSTYTAAPTHVRCATHREAAGLAAHQQEQSDNYLSQAFHYLSDHLGGGTKGEVLAGGLVGAGLVATGGALVAALPEEAAAAVGAGVVEGAEIVGDVVMGAASQSGALKKAATKTVSNALSAVREFADEHIGEFSEHTLESIEHLWSWYEQQKEAE